MKKQLKIISLSALTLTAAILSGCGSLPFLSDPWEGTWWGVQNAGPNWTGDEIRNLETFTFTREGDTVKVEHKTQRGGKEIDGDFTGSAVPDGGRLTITPEDGGREVTLTFSRTGREIETPLKNADGSAVTLKELTAENNTEMEEIRSAIVKISQRPENAVNTTLSRR